MLLATFIIAGICIAVIIPFFYLASKTGENTSKQNEMNKNNFLDFYNLIFVYVFFAALNIVNVDATATITTTTTNGTTVTTTT